jgi:pyruvate kinase
MSANDQVTKRHTKIVCTIGPSCSKEDQLVSLVKCGMNVARLNLTHASADLQSGTIRKLKEIRSDRPIGFGILLDIRCAQVRTGVVEKPIVIEKGQEVCFGVEKLRKNAGKHSFVSVDYSAFGKDARAAEILLLDNGEMSFDILSISKDGMVRARALQGGAIGSRRHVNMPGASISLPTFTASDWRDIDTAIRERVDFLAVSFIRSSKDIQEIRRYLTKKKCTIQIIAKIETRQAVEDLEAIIAASDGIMVARGDLGAEIPFEQVPALQDRIVDACRQAAKPVIVATHMLESMMKHPLPTRAEATDVAHAASTRADATMLSGETASGRHPLVALDAMHRILSTTESHMSPLMELQVEGATQARAQIAVQLAHSTKADAIVVMTRSGRSAAAISKFRPLVPIIAITEDEQVWGQLALCYGVRSLKCSFAGELESSANRGIQQAKNVGLLRKGMSIVLVSGTEITGGSTISVQARTVQ